MDDRHRILLNDLVVAETEKLVAAIGDAQFPLQGAKPTEQEFRARLARYEVASETLSALLLHGCRWGPQHADLWVRSLERVANFGTDHAGYTVWVQMRHYPALILMYSAGIGALAAGDYGTLAAILLRATVRQLNHQGSFASELHPWSVVKADVQKQWVEPGRKTPLSDHLYGVLRDSSSDLIPEEASHEELFDRFEYFLALVYADDTGDWAPVGSFGWRTRHMDGVGAVSRLNAEAEREGSHWAALRAGFFSGSVERFQKARDFVTAWVATHFRW